MKMRECMDNLQDEFNKIMISIQSRIASENVPLMLFRQLITSLCVSQKQNIPLFSPQMMNEIINYSFDEIFLFLTRNEVWDFLNFHVLKKIVKQFINDAESINQSIAVYQMRVDRFKRETYLPDYIKVRASGASPIPGCKDVMVKIERDYGTFTLEQLSDEEEFLCSQFLLNQFIFRFKESRSGCVQITWLIPEAAVNELMPAKLAENGEALKEHGILEIRVDNRYVYMVSNIHCTYINFSLPITSRAIRVHVANCLQDKGYATSQVEANTLRGRSTCRILGRVVQ